LHTVVGVVLVALTATFLTTTDAHAVSCSGISAWSSASVSYAVGSTVTYNNKKFTCQQGHTSQAGWDPVSFAAGWVDNGTCDAGSTPTTRPRATATTAPRATATTAPRATATATTRPRTTPTATTRPRATATATTAPRATATSGGGGVACFAAWSSTTNYATGGLEVSRTCSEPGAGNVTRNYRSSWGPGTGTDPCTPANSWRSGPWTPQSACGSSQVVGAISSLVSHHQFDQIWPLYHYGAVGVRSSTFQYVHFVEAAAAYPALGGTGDTPMKLREMAAYFANKTQETGLGQYDRELWCNPGGQGYNTKGCGYNCTQADIDQGLCGYCAKPASAGGNSICLTKQFWGRHSIQLSWNTNYAAAEAQVPGATGLGTNPDLIFSNPALGWKVANWYWMTQLGPRYEDCKDAKPTMPAGCVNLQSWPHESAHAAMIAPGSSGNHFFGGTIRAINGAIECVSGQTGQTNRINYYATIRGILGAGPSVGRDTCF
jgi:hypothetical protein